MSFMIDVQYTEEIKLIRKNENMIEMFIFHGNDPSASFKCYSYGENAKKLHLLVKVLIQI